MYIHLSSATEHSEYITVCYKNKYISNMPSSILASKAKILRGQCVSSSPFHSFNITEQGELLSYFKFQTCMVHNIFFLFNVFRITLSMCDPWLLKVKRRVYKYYSHHFIGSYPVFHTVNNIYS